MSHGQSSGVNVNFAVVRTVFQHFYFFVLNFFFNIPISENGKGKADVSTVTTLYPEIFASNYFSVENFFLL